MSKKATPVINFPRYKRNPFIMMIGSFSRINLGLEFWVKLDFSANEPRNHN